MAVIAYLKTMSIDQREYNILGCNIRVKTSEDQDNKAAAAINLLQEEIEKVKLKNPQVNLMDVAVLSALNLASKCIAEEAEHKENIFALKSGVEDALKYVEQVSSGENAQLN